MGTAAAGVALAGITALGAGLTWAIGQAMEAQDGLAELEAVIESTGGIANVTAEEAQKLASGFQDITRFSDDAILAGESMLLTFTNIGSDVFPQATEAMLNLAQKFGSMETASVQLGKALNDPVAGVTALRRVGVQLTDAQEETIQKMVAMGDIAGAQAVILNELETEFGGLAVAAGSTAAGKIDIFKNKLGEAGETIGGAFLPLIALAADKVSAWVDSPGFQAGVAAITAGIQSIIDVVTPLAEGNTLLALQNLQHTLMNFGVDPKAIQGITDLLSGNIFGKEKMTPGGKVETGGLLRSMGMSDEEVASAKAGMDSIIRDFGRIGESFGKIFGDANAAGMKETVGAFGNIAAAVTVIANSVGAVERVVAAIAESGVVKGAIAVASAVQISPKDVANTLRPQPAGFQGAPPGGFGGQFGGSIDFAALTAAIVGAFSVAPAPLVTVNATLDGAQIASSVSSRLGDDSQSLNRIGGHAPLR